MTAERDSTMTLVHREFADSLEKESKRPELPNGWVDVLTAAHTSIRTLADAIDAHLATRDAVVSDEDVERAYNICDRFVDEHGGLADEIDDGQWCDVLRTILQDFASRKVAVPDAISLMQRALEDGNSGGAAIWREGLENAIAVLNGACAKCHGKGFYYGGDGHAYKIKCACRKAMLASQDEVK